LLLSKPEAGNRLAAIDPWRETMRGGLAGGQACDGFLIAMIKFEMLADGKALSQNI
jgi:hypothetical protein